MPDVAVSSDPGRPVGRLVAPVIVRVSALVVVMAAVCIGGIVFATQSVNDLTHDLERAATTHQTYVEGVDGLEVALSGYAASADRSYVDTYTELRARYDRDLEALEAAVADRNELDLAVTREVESVSRWLTFADASLAEPAGPASFDASRYARSQRLFTGVRITQGETVAALAEARADGGNAAVLRLRLTIAAALLLVGLSWLMIGRARAQLLRELAEPLTTLEKVVQRMLKNDPEGRAQAGRGPREVRAIARALNDFAEAQSRARAGEGRIQDELHVLDSAKDDFVSNVSHELRTPLTTISGYLEMVADGLGLRIVQTIIDKHAGDVVIESVEGEGTTVFVRLRVHGERARAPLSGAGPATEAVRLDDDARV